MTETESPFTGNNEGERVLERRPNGKYHSKNTFPSLYAGRDIHIYSTRERAEEPLLMCFFCKAFPRSQLCYLLLLHFFSACSPSLSLSLFRCMRASIADGDDESDKRSERREKKKQNVIALVCVCVERMSRRK